MRTARWILVLAAAAALLGCGAGNSSTTGQRAEKPQRPELSCVERSQRPEKPRRPGKPRKLHFGLDGAPSPQNVGALMAGRMKYLNEAGFDTWFREPVGPYRPIPYVAGELVDLSISHLPEVVLARERGVPVVAVASLVPQPTAAMIWLEGSEIEDIADLEGKTIAIPGVSFQKRFLEVILAQAGLTLADVEVVNGGYELASALASGRADAIFGGSGNVEGAELEARGLKPVVADVRNFGMPAYDELVVIVRRDRLVEEPQVIRNILATVARGTAAAIEDPVEAATAIAAEVLEPNRRAIAAGIEATLPLLSKSGRMSPERAERLVDWMLEEGMIQRPLPASELLTNDCLGSAP